MIKRNGPWAVPLASFTLATVLGLLAGPLAPVLGHRAAAAVTCDCIAKLESAHDSLVWSGDHTNNNAVNEFNISIEPVSQLAKASKQLAGALTMTLNATATLHVTYTIKGTVNGGPFQTDGNTDMDIQVNPKQINHSTKVNCPTGEEFTTDKFAASLNSMIANAKAKVKATYPEVTNPKFPNFTLSFIGNTVKSNVHAASTCANSDAPCTIPLTGWPLTGSGTDFADFPPPQ